MQWVPFRYRDFWDVPRMFLIQHENRHILFDCPWDEQEEDYNDKYQIYLMPALPEKDLEGSWAGLPQRAILHLGAIPVPEVRFDSTRRQQVDSTILDSFANARDIAAG